MKDIKNYCIDRMLMVHHNDNGSKVKLSNKYKDIKYCILTNGELELSISIDDIDFSENISEDNIAISTNIAEDFNIDNDNRIRFIALEFKDTTSLNQICGMHIGDSSNTDTNPMRSSDYTIMTIPMQFHISEDDEVTSTTAVIPAQYFLYNDEIFEYVAKKINEAIVSPLIDNLKICYNVDTNPTLHEGMDGGILSVSLDQKWVEELLRNFMNLEIANSNTYKFILKHDSGDLDCVYSTIYTGKTPHPIKHNLYKLVKAAIEEYIEEYGIVFAASLDISGYFNPIEVEIQDKPGFLNCTIVYRSKNAPRFADGIHGMMGIKIIKGGEK